MSFPTQKEFPGKSSRCGGGRKQGWRKGQPGETTTLLRLDILELVSVSDAITVYLDHRFIPLAMIWKLIRHYPRKKTLFKVES